MSLSKSILVGKVVWLISVMFLLNSFAYREPNYCKMSDYIVRNYIKEFAKPRRLMLTGSGGRMMYDIEEITLRFLSYRTLNVNEARTLYVEMMEEFLQRVNCHEKIRPHLHNFPFEVDNIELTIGFNDAKGILGGGHVAHMFIGNNSTLHFAAYDPKIEDFYSLHEESYEEAVEIVKNQSDGEKK